MAKAQVKGMFFQTPVTSGKSEDSTRPASFPRTKGSHEVLEFIDLGFFVEWVSTLVRGEFRRASCAPATLVQTVRIVLCYH